MTAWKFLLVALCVCSLIGIAGAVTQINFTVGADNVSVFNGTAGATVWTCPPGVSSVWYTVVAGGGSGGAQYGGGGGAGGLLNGTYACAGGVTYNVVVGAGGAGVAGSGTANGNNGTNSSFANSTPGNGFNTLGGGGGGAATPFVGLNGGSGGGGSWFTSNVSLTRGGANITGQGMQGGNGTRLGSGGGGGSAYTGYPGNVSGNQKGGDGGNSTSISITGVSTKYAGGGGGVGLIAPGLGWLNNGGNGTIMTGINATAGVANTGSGGGGTGSAGTSGAGAAGVVILRYTPPLTASFTSNKTVTLPNYAVQFNDTSIGGATTWDWNFGDGSANVTTQNPTHTYTYATIFPVNLIVGNATGGKSAAYSGTYEAVPFPYVYTNSTTINYGIPQNVSLIARYIESADGIQVNVTFNNTRLQFRNIFFGPGATTGDTLSTWTGTGYVKINASFKDNTWYNNQTVAYLQFNVTNTTGNTTEPLNIQNSGGMFPNLSRTPTTLIPWQGRYAGIITPTNASMTQTFNIYRTDTDELLNNVQVTNVYTGVINGTQYTTTGTFYVTSTWGFINLTSTASAFYQNDLYNVEITGGTTDVRMTPYVSNKQTWYAPHQVQFIAEDSNGKRLPDVLVSAVATGTTFPAGAQWERSIYGIDPAAANQMLDGTLVMQGDTGSDGSVVFTMLASIGYAISLTEPTTGVTTFVNVYPTESSYTVKMVGVASTVNNTYLDMGYNQTLWIDEPNASFVTLHANYTDMSARTSLVEFYVVNKSNDTLINYQYRTNPGLSTTYFNYTVPNFRGIEYNVWWNAVRVI